MKFQNYALGEKVWFNSKHIKTKRKQKLKAKFFGLFQVLHLFGKQAYKLELPARWKIYNMFHVLLVEQDIIKKGQEFSVPEFKPDNNKEYELEAI